MAGEKKKLRFITYLCPDIPVEVFQTYMHYLQEVTRLDTYLIYESRYTGPPTDKPDPFMLDEVDIGFMSSTDFLRLSTTGQSVELCEAGPVHQHVKNLGRAVYYCDLIINTANKKKYTELHDLRGHTLVYSSPSALTSLSLMEHLKKNGADAGFFRDHLTAGSDKAAIASVMNSDADVAAVNSIALERAVKSCPVIANSVQVLTSLGPLPSYPVVFNKNLPDELKKTMTEALLNMDKKPEWLKALNGLNISGFVACDQSLYSLETDIVGSVGKTVKNTTYY